MSELTNSIFYTKVHPRILFVLCLLLFIVNGIYSCLYVNNIFQSGLEIVLGKQIVYITYSFSLALLDPW